jgi:hypothetical protein
MAITFKSVGSASALNSTDTTPIVMSVAMPGTFVAGDLLLLMVGARNGGTIATPAGWTQVFALSHETTPFPQIKLFRKVAGAGEPAVDVTYTGAAGHVIIGQVAAFAGVDASVPFPEIGAESENVSQQNIGPITGLTISAGSAVIVFGVRSQSWTSVDELTGDGLTWDEIDEPDSDLGSNAGMVWDYAISAGGATVTAKTFNVIGGTAQVGIGVMVEMAEQAAGGGGGVPRFQGTYRRRRAG